MIDYEVLDLIKRFTVTEAACLWCEIARVTEDNRSRFLHVRSALIQAIQEEELKTEEIPQKLVERRIRSSLYDIPEPQYEMAVISRRALKAWAERNNQKPKFLFPEMREQVVSGKPGVAESSAKPQQRENDMHRLLEKVFLTLMAEYNRPPQAKDVLRALEKNLEKFDTDEIVDEIKGDAIYWHSADGNEGAMELKTLRNRVSLIKKKVEKQKLKKKIPA